MAPNIKETHKSTPQMHRVNNKSNIIISNSPKKSLLSTVKKTNRALIKDCKTVTATPRNRTTTSTLDTKVAMARQRTTTEQKLATPKPKENRPPQPPDSVTKSGSKPSWKRRPKPAHSGVPVPEKMRKLLNKFLEDENKMQRL